MSVRTQHVGKAPQEREAYRNFLSSKFQLEKTVEEDENIWQSDASSLKEEALKKEKITPKSNWLRFKDFIHNNWVVSIVSSLGVGLVLLLLGGYIDVKSDQGAITEKMNSINTRIENIETENTKQTDLISTINEAVAVLRAETVKELEFMKERFNFLNN